MNRRGIALLTVLGALALSGCGDSSEEPEDQVTEVASAFAVALGSGDAKAACVHYDQTQFKGLPAQSGCVSLFDEQSAFYKSFRTADVEKVVIKGKNAVVGLSNDQILRMSEGNDGTWVVDNLGGTKSELAG